MKRKPNSRTLRAAIRGSVPDGKLRGAKIVLAENTDKAAIGGFTEYDEKRKGVSRLGAPAGDRAFDITVRGHETRHATRHCKPRRKKAMTENEAIASQIVDDVNIETTALPSVSLSGLEAYRRAHLATAVRDLRDMLRIKRNIPETRETRNAQILSSVRVKAMLRHYRGGAIGRTFSQSVKNSFKVRDLIGEETNRALNAVITLAKSSRTRARAISMLTMLLEEPPASDNPEGEERPEHEKGDRRLFPEVYGDVIEGKMTILDLRPKSAYTAKERQISCKYAPDGVHLNPVRYVSAIVSG